MQKRQLPRIVGTGLLWLAIAVFWVGVGEAAWIGAKSGIGSDPGNPDWVPPHLVQYGSEQNVSGRYVLPNGTDLVDEHGGICAAVATMNSFVYLENRYPEIYDSKLTGGDPQQATEDLAAGWDGRSGMYGPEKDSTSGSASRIWESKLHWIEDKAPGTTVFHGQYFGSTDGWYGSELLEANTYPTWEFLWEELAKCQDIEIGFDSHCVTLVDLFFNDTNENGIRDFDEALAIGYLDPNPDPYTNSQFRIADLTETPNQTMLQFTWWQDAEEWPILFAFVESPVPEPAAVVIWLVLAGSSGLVIRHRRR